MSWANFCGVELAADAETSRALTLELRLEIGEECDMVGDRRSGCGYARLEQRLSDAESPDTSTLRMSSSSNTSSAARFWSSARVVSSTVGRSMLARAAA